jgi:site-specific DNA recombinase
MRAGIYARISDDREGAGLGVARQEKDCRGLADQRGWTVRQVYVDNDVSAFKGKARPAYSQLLADIEAGLVDVVVAWHTDRLHRAPVELERYISVCEPRGVPTETVKAGALDLATPAGRMVARMLGSAARYESEHKSDRSRRKALELAEAGKVGNGGFRPFGYARDRVTIVEEEAEVLRQAYADVAAGKALRVVCADLNARGVLTTQGGRWSLQGLRYNLLTGRNAGLREHHRQIVGPAVWPAIVDRETWETVRAQLLDRPRAIAYARRHLLTGLLFCGRCGAKLLPRRNAQRQRYGCPPKLDGGCGGILTLAEPTEDFIVEAVLRRIEQQADLTPDEDDPTDRLLAAIAADEQRLEQLAEAFADDPDANPLELRAAGARIRRRISESRAQVAQAVTTARVAEPLAVRPAWAGYDLSQRRGVLTSMVERIVVGAAKPGPRFDPTRFHITWR